MPKTAHSVTIRDHTHLGDKMLLSDKAECRALYHSIAQYVCSTYKVTPSVFHTQCRYCMRAWGDSPTQWDRWVDAANSVRGDFDVLRGGVR